MDENLGHVLALEFGKKTELLSKVNGLGAILLAGILWKSFCWNFQGPAGEWGSYIHSPGCFFLAIGDPQVATSSPVTNVSHLISVVCELPRAYIQQN